MNWLMSFSSTTADWVFLMTSPGASATAGCPTGLSCYAYNNEHTDCRLTGTTAEAQPCVRSEDCRPGMACLGPAGAERCRVLCQRSNGSGCMLGQTCTAVTYSGGAQWPTYGACL